MDKIAEQHRQNMSKLMEEATVENVKCQQFYQKGKCTKEQYNALAAKIGTETREALHKEYMDYIQKQHAAFGDSFVETELVLREKEWARVKEETDKQTNVTPDAKKVLKAQHDKTVTFLRSLLPLNKEENEDEKEKQ